MASFTEDVEETITVSDATDIVQDAIPTLEETVSLSEVLDHVQTTSEDLSETVTVSDSVFESNNIPIDVVNDAITVDDEVLELFSVYPTTDESVSISEAFDSLQTGDQPADETVPLTESLSEATSTAEVLLETVTVSDAVLESLGVPVPANETVTVSEAITHLQTFEEPQAEAISVSEVLVESQGTEYALPESVTITEAETEVFDVRPTTDETVTVTETLDHTQTTEEVSSETVTVTDNITIGFPVDVVDSVALAEAVDHAQGHITDVAASVAIAEGLLPVFGGTIAEAENVAVIEAVDYYVGVPAPVAESVAVSEAVANLAYFSQVAGESVIVTETRLNADVFGILFHTVVVNETLDIAQTFSQAVSESVIVSESATAVRQVSPISLSETVSVADGIGFLGGKTVLVSETVNVTSGVAVPYSAGVFAPVSLSITEDSVAQNDYIRNLSEIVTIIVSAFTEGSAAAASLTPTTVQMFVGVEVHPSSLTNLAAYNITPVDGGVPIRVQSVELIQPAKEYGKDASVQESGYHIFFPYTNVVDVGDYLDIEGARYSFESLRITTVDNVNQIVTVDRRVISTDPKNGELTWTLKRAATGALITVSEATANATYRIRMSQLDKKTGGLVDVNTTFVALDPEPVSETYSTDPLTGSITITFSRPIAVEPTLLRPSLYSVSGPSEVSVVSVSMPAPNQVLVRTTPTFVSGSYHLAFPPLRDQALNRIGV
jgi:hypothetical protein